MYNIKSLKKIAQEFSLLYVEDDKDLRKSTAEIFKGLFKETFIAEDGQEGIDTYYEYFNNNEKYVDVVITDIQMPNMNGIELSKKILSINEKQKILIISAYDDKRYLIELINIGITGFIQKPLNTEQITSILYDLCNELAQERELFRFLNLGDDFVWDTKDKVLANSDFYVELTENETKLLDLLASNMNKKLTSLEIFEHIYKDDEKEFSLDVIKSMIKRLRKKLPEDLIVNTPQSGYNLQL